MVELSQKQLDAIDRLKNGSILCGGVGSGKSRTALAYYMFKVCQGKVPCNGDKSIEEMKYPRDLYIITTAMKRDTHEWEDEAQNFRLFKNKENNFCDINLVIDSWNNIKKYNNVTNGFFIFDEQRVVGSGAWVKAFLKIANKNKWILLTATPGDTWQDYRPVFIANGFYKNKTDFNAQHIIWNRFSKFPKVDGYVNQGVLIKHRREVLIELQNDKKTTRHTVSVPCEYSKENYKQIWKYRWNIFDDEPIKETGKLFYLLRRAVNSDESREAALVNLLETIPKVIIFYNFDYELDILRDVCERMQIPYAEWNGHVHEEIPKTNNWAYLVNYAAGAEGWNCIETDSMIFYSLNYSYRTTEQAAGRIDRMNTPFKDLYYYQLRSYSPIDSAILKALHSKRSFNETNFLKNSQK